MTLFPEMIKTGLSDSIIGRAIESGSISVNAVDIRDYTLDKHKKVDDYPYGGGAGMLMQAQPVYDCYKALEKQIGHRTRVLFMTPQGKTFNQEMAEELSKEDDIIFLCGHYEGIDERVLEEIVTDEVSIGDFVLTGGEMACMVMIDAVSRLVPGVLSNEDSAVTESFAGNLLEYPQYSRPEEWMGKRVPDVLLSGNHKEVDKWRLEMAVERTKKKRPDMYSKYERECEIRELLLKDKPLNMDMIEALRLGEKRLFYDKDGVIALCDSGKKMFLVYSDNEEGLEGFYDFLVEKGYEKNAGVLFRGIETSFFEQKGFIKHTQFNQAVYTRGVLIKNDSVNFLTADIIDKVNSRLADGKNPFFMVPTGSSEMLEIYENLQFRISKKTLAFYGHLC